MSIWDSYPNLTQSQFRTLVAVTAQVLLDVRADGSDVPADLLQQSTLANARQLTPLLKQADPSVSREDIQEMLEDEGLATQASRAVLDQVRTVPEIAARIAEAYDARQDKMTGVELVLLAGAIVVLAIKIRRIKTGPDGVELNFEPSGEAVKAFVTGLVKGATGQR